MAYTSKLYSVLPENTIRLLRLAPNTDRLEIDLSVHAISELPSFEAVSYAWGTESFTEQIMCCARDPDHPELPIESTLPVTPHLLEGLKCLRSTAAEDETRWLWIDAICINQGNDREKSIQVPLMSDIYSRARRVIVWLGKAEDDDEATMQRIPELALKLAAVEDLQDVTFRTMSLYGLPDERDTPDAIWYKLTRWYDRVWFKRLWVVQEAYLAHDILFLCGNTTVTFTDAFQFATHWRQTQIVPASEYTGGLPAGLEFLETLTDVKSIASEASGTVLLMMPLVTRELHCRNLVDRVYGILGMLPQQVREKIVVDYSRENKERPEKLFTHVAKLALEEESDINRFALFWSMSKPRMLHAPSWVPGYMYPLDGQALHMERAGLPKDPSSPYYDPQISTSLSVSPDSFQHPDNIKVRGMVVDRIAGVVHLDWQWTYHLKGQEDDVNIRIRNTSEFLRIEAECRNLAAKIGIISCAESQTYCRTLVANRNIQKPGPYNLDDVCQDYQDAVQYFQLRRTGVDQQGLRPNRPRLHRYVSSISEKWKSGRSFFITTGGRVGIGGFNSQLKTGDQLCIFFGAHQLFVLREVPGHEIFLMVGDAYVHGLMDCEAFGLLDPEVSAKRFEIC